MTNTCNVDQTWLAHRSRCQEKPVLAFNIVYCEESNVSISFCFTWLDLLITIELLLDGYERHQDHCYGACAIYE